ncbi:hypothetical protein AKUH3B209X_11750 [Apilactobacillus kunkeei]|nr:hypothetical protein AKUH3B209X_11750 [Apilactobacillus kunkeei]CAI2687453.1 hypothetical protein AKUH4B507J_11220 [Apilactobacillus kunkeei]
MIKVKNLLLTALVATFMVGGIASVEEASVNANAQTVHVHHAKKHAKKHSKKHAKKHTKKHSKKRVVKKHVKKSAKKHVRKVAKKHVAKKHVRKVAKKHVAKKVTKKSVKKVAPKKVTNKVAKKDTNKLSSGVTDATIPNKYGLSGQNIDTPKWSVYHGDGSKKSIDEYQLNMAKHDPYLRKQLQAKGAKKYLADITDDEVTF